MAHVISKDGTKIVYDLYGQGSVLIYITGAICHRTMGPVVKDAKHFAQSFKVAVYDRRGRGDSEDNPPYSIDKELDDLEALIDALGGRAHLYGHSSGAVLALEAMMRFPQKISKAVVYDTPYLADSSELAAYQSLRSDIEKSLQNKNYGKAVKQFLIGIGMPRVFSYLIPLMPGWARIKQLAPTLLYDMTLTTPLAPLERAQTIKVPYQIVYGGKTHGSIRSVAAQMKSLVPPENFIEVPGQGHAISPSVLLPYLKRFLA